MNVSKALKIVIPRIKDKSGEVKNIFFTKYLFIKRFARKL